MVENKLSPENRPAEAWRQPTLMTSRFSEILLVSIQHDQLGEKCVTRGTTRLDIHQKLSLEKINALI